MPGTRGMWSSRTTCPGRSRRRLWRLATATVALGSAVGLVATAGTSAAAPTPSPPSIKQQGGTAVVGNQKTDRITATGYPKPTFSEAGALPSGMTFVSGNGSAEITGTPGPGTGNDYFINITATNSQGSDTEPYDLTVQQNPLFPPGFCPANMTVGQYVHDDESVAAYPPFFGLEENNTLPDGVQYNQNGDNDDLGTLSGTPQPGSGGMYGLQYSSDANNTTRNLHCKLVVDEPPTFTDTGMAVVTAGTTPSAALTIGGTPGYPKSLTLTDSGSAPSGLVVHTVHNGKGFAVNLVGTPKTGSQGDYLFHVSADNGLTSNEDFVLVDQAAGTTPAPTAVTLTPGTDPVTYPATSQTYTATVTGGTAPSGYVQFSIGNGIDATVPLTDGSASYTTPNNLDVNDYTVTATYTGDALNASSSNTTDLTVAPAPTTLQLMGSSTSTAFGVSVTYTATVACNPDCGGQTPSGFVDFNANGNDTDVDLVDGQATFTTDPTVGPGLANEVDATFSSFTDAAGDFAASPEESDFYDIGAVNLATQAGDGVQADGTTSVANGGTVTVDPTAVNEFSVQMTAVARGNGNPPGPLNFDVAAGSTDETSALGLADGNEPAPVTDPGDGLTDYFWTLPAGDLDTIAGNSATVTVSTAGSDDFVGATLTFTLSW